MRYSIVSGDTLRKLHTTSVKPAWRMRHYDRRPGDMEPQRAWRLHDWLQYAKREDEPRQ